MLLPTLFADHMVLQRNQTLPIWGWAEPGEKVSVEFVPGPGGANKPQKKSGAAGADGKWAVELDALKACATPAAIRVTSPSGKVEIADVLVGDVWLCGGQSNMEWRLQSCAFGPAEIPTADVPQIRHFGMPLVVDYPPQRDVNGAWAVCSPETAGQFTAVGYHFAREVFRAEQVPIGLVNNSWGGSAVEPWISRAALVTDPLCRADVERYDRDLAGKDTEELRRLRKEYAANPNKAIREVARPDPGNEGEGRGWASPGFDDSAWAVMTLPSGWKQAGVMTNGVLWFRRSVQIPPAWAGRDLVLHLGAADKHDWTYLNGERVGQVGWETVDSWCVPRHYRIPGRLVKAGRNVLAVRVYSWLNEGGLTGPAKQMFIELAGPSTSLGTGESAGEKVMLAGEWRYVIEHDFGPIWDSGIPGLVPNMSSPHALYDNLVAPLAPFGLCGVLWYQGESNAGQPIEYRTRFRMMIRDWRRAWGRELPFLFVQLAGYLPAKNPGNLPDWPRLREAQTLALAEPKTAMAVAIDIGNAIDIHPTNKRDVGRRLALAAEKMVYGRAVIASGPMFESMKVRGPQACVRFANCDGGLIAANLFDETGQPVAAAKDTTAKIPLTGFEIAGADREFHVADATIDGDSVVVSSPKVAQPVAVRYAWADCPACNLYNSAKLPAVPFRTDEW